MPNRKVYHVNGEELFDAIRAVENALGNVSYQIAKNSEENIRSKRPGFGLHARYFDEIIGRCANKDIKHGTPIIWDVVGK